MVECKIVFLGEAAVGKTSIITQFTENEFTPDQNSTIGACFSMKKVKCDENTNVNLKIWDTAGQERFRALTPIYYRDAQVAILVFSVIERETFKYNVYRPETFEKLQVWIDFLHETEDSTPFIILGNKIDLVDERTVSTDEGERFASSVNATYMECSAKSKEGIEEVFIAAAQIAADNRVEAKTQQTNEVKIPDNDNQQKKKKKDCC